MEINKMHNIAKLINHDINNKLSNIVFAKYKCGCGEHVHNTKIKKNDKIQMCKGCKNFMGFECIKYDNSLCLICMKKKGKNIEYCVMCSSCGDIVKMGEAYIYCRICKDRRSLCGHYLWLLCQKCMRK